MPNMIGTAGLALDVLFSFLDLQKGKENEEWSKEQRAEFERLLGDARKETEGKLGEGFRATLTGLQNAYNKYGRVSEGVTKRALELSAQNYKDLEKNIGADKAASMMGWTGRQGEIFGGYNKRWSDLSGKYDERLKTGMGMTKDFGVQEEKDLLKAYKGFGESQQAGLAARGMGGTTITSNLAQGNLREQSDAKARLADLISRQKLDVYGKLSGEGLAAEERLTGEGLLANERISSQTLSMSDYWRNMATKTAAEKGFAEQDITLAGMGNQADIGLQKDLGAVDLASQYYGSMAGIPFQSSGMWGNFMTQNPVEFMDYSSGINLGGQMISYDQITDQQREAKKAQSDANALGWANLGTIAGTGGLSLAFPNGIGGYGGLSGGRGTSGYTPSTLTYGPWSSYYSGW